MANHVHLLIKEGKDDISRIMRRINTSYAYYFNKKYNRIGHVFQDRLRSEVIEDEKYLLAVTRYIHNNPVKANIVKEPSEYKWSSYSSYLAGEDSNIVRTTEILEMFSTDKQKAIKSFIEFTNEVNDDVFVECREDEKESKVIFSAKDAKAFAEDFLRNNRLIIEDLKKKDSVKLRNDLIENLKHESSLSMREIADVLDLNRGVVQRSCQRNVPLQP